MKTMVKDKVVPMTFQSFQRKRDHVAIIHGSYYRWIGPYLKVLDDMYLKDTGVPLKRTTFDNISQFNEWVYSAVSKKDLDFFLLFGFDFHRQYPYTFTLFYNSTGGSDPFRLLAPEDKSIGGEVMLTRMVWKNEFGENNDFRFSHTLLIRRTVDLVFAFLGPSMISLGLLSIIPLIVSQPVADITGEVRDYLQSCSMKLLPYWVSTFMVDFLVWIVLVSTTTIFLVLSDVLPIVQNKFNLWYVMVISGIGFLLMLYCLSFMFKTSDSATMNIYFMVVIVFLVPMIIDMLIGEKETPMWLEWFWALFPHINCMRVSSRIMRNAHVLVKPFSYYWSTRHEFPYMCSHFINIFLYSIILWIIEIVRVRFYSMNAHDSFTKFGKNMKIIREKQTITEEAIQMEKMVEQSHDFALRLYHVSRIFYNSEGNPIPAVNDISLGIKSGSVFGFLGANGAGKSTLMKIMTSMIPLSSGSVEINGFDISTLNERSHISVCPQFNSHLIPELTPSEHFYLFSLIFGLNPCDMEKKCYEILDILEMYPYINTLVKDLSGGQQRKLCVALSFMAPSDIVLLDEPTSSLDPYSRHSVHRLVSRFQGEKTILLCTHLLGEAEALCDTISIMAKGCLFTCGTPQYLSAKFGTEFRIDIGLIDSSKNSTKKCEDFFAKHLPQARLGIVRPLSRVYAIPSDSISLSDLFEIMQYGKKEDYGISYYTCTTSTLETVFLEIMKMADNDASNSFLSL